MKKWLFATLTTLSMTVSPFLSVEEKTPAPTESTPEPTESVPAVSVGLPVVAKSPVVAQPRPTSPTASGESAGAAARERQASQPGRQQGSSALVPNASPPNPVVSVSGSGSGTSSSSSQNNARSTSSSSPGVSQTAKPDRPGFSTMPQKQNPSRR